MPLLPRSDGTFVENLPPLRRMMPHIMPGRNQSAVAFEQVLDLSKTLPFIESYNARTGGKHLTLLQLVMTAMLRTFEERPMLNRFIVGRRLYQRKAVEFSFAIKRTMNDQGGLTTTKIRLDGEDTLETVGAKMEPEIRAGKTGAESKSDVEMRVLAWLPRSLLRLLIWLQGVLDYWSLLPAFMIRNDPLYTSMFFANLGSVGLESAFHHLYEYGTCSFFATLGKVKRAVVVDENDQPTVRNVVSLKYLFDERITDGFYCARSLEIFQHYVENPELLLSARASAS